MSNRDDVDLVKSRSDILQVIAPYVSLKRAGKLYKGLCPFHNEKTPSFSVNPELGIWNCFGQCGEGGDVFKFVQKIENLTFPEALERLALQAGVTLTPPDRSGERRPAAAAGEKDRLFNACAAAVRYYQLGLSRNEAPRAYLTNRGISDQSQSRFYVGYAPDDWEGLFRYLEAQRVDPRDAVTAGVLVQGERGGYYDKFRGRIIFPIFDVQDRPIAFGGRLMESVEGRPKYLNSAETPLFFKTRTLYGLGLARKAIADANEALIVEGYLDVISCHQAGVQNVVATLGTSITADHVQILARYSRRALLAFDSDTAGQKATEKASQLFESQDFDVRVLRLPEGEDPDSLLKAGRLDEFHAAMRDAVTAGEHRLRRALVRLDPASSSEAERSAFFQRDIVPLLRSTKSVIERERYVQIAAPWHPFYRSGASYAEAQIRRDVDGRAAPAAAQRGSSSQRTRWNSDRGRPEKSYPGSAEAPISVISGMDHAEQTILQALLGDDPQIAERARQSIKAELFTRASIATLVRHILAHERIAEGVGAALQDESLRADPSLLPLVMGEAEPTPGLTMQVLDDALARLRSHAMTSMIKKLKVLGDNEDTRAQALYDRVMRRRKGDAGKPLA